MGGSADRTKLIVLAGFALVAVVIVGIVLIASGGDDDGGDGGAETTASTGDCEQVEAPKPKQVSFEAPPQSITKGEDLTAVVATSCGEFEIELDSQRAPKTVNSFVFLSEEGLYDGLIFHRIVPGFVIQGGDPLGTGTGGPGFSTDEQPPANLAYTKGVVAMAKSSAEPPGRSGSQFFVVLGPDAGLPPEYALVGEVGEGMDVVERIGGVDTGTDETPEEPVTIDSITIDRG